MTDLDTAAHARPATSSRPRGAVWTVGYPEAPGVWVTVAADRADVDDQARRLSREHGRAEVCRGVAHAATWVDGVKQPAATSVEG